MRPAAAGRLIHVALPVLALLLLAAHFYRAGVLPLAAAAIAATGLAFMPRPWAGRTLGLVLLCAALEWLRTAWVFATLRDSMGLPYGRLLAILGGVALFTLVSAYVAWRSAEIGSSSKIN